MRNNRLANRHMPIRRMARYMTRKANRMSLNRKSGYSNNSDYVGDWFGDGQIDFTKIINPNDSGDVYMVKLWCGSGYATDVYLVKANDLYDAIDRVFEWSYRNDGENYLVYDYHYIEKEAEYYYNDEGFFERGKKPSDDMEFGDFLDDIIDEYYIGNSDYMLFARSENFFADRVPEKYLKKSSIRRAAIRRGFRRI